MIERENGHLESHILVADDTPQSLALLSDFLRSKGYLVHSVQNGAAVLEAVADQSYDLLLVDVEMPEMTGYEVCEQLKASETTRDLPVILLSEAKDTGGILRAFDIGAVDYITKPFKLREVLARVVNHLTLVQQRRQIESLRDQDRQAYVSLDKMKNEFISMATHDLKSPLNIMLGYTGLLAEIDVMEHDRELLQQAIQEMQHSIDKMHMLVTSILDLAQMETRATLAIEPVPLQPILEQTVRDYEIIALDKGIALECTLPEEPLMVRADANRIMRVFDNLVSNAIKYTPSGGRVELRASGEDSEAVVQVVDTGYGIPADAISHLFDAFFRVNEARHRASEGTGLGLAIVKTIVEQHNGVIDVHSELGAGSTFSVRLPLVAG